MFFAKNRLQTEMQRHLFSEKRIELEYLELSSLAKNLPQKANSFIYL
jgi:hypothetical protein